MAYWTGSGIAPLGDTRNFTRPTPTALAPQGPRPFTPTDQRTLDEVLVMSEEEARPSLLRCLEFFGAERLPGRPSTHATAQLRIPFGLGDAAPTLEVDPASVKLEVLKKAAEACVRQAAEAGGAAIASTEDAEPMRDPELAKLARRFLSNCPPFETWEHDAVAVVLLAQWSFNERIPECVQPLTTERWEELLAMLRQDEGGIGVPRVLGLLKDGGHATGDGIATLMRQARWLVAQARQAPSP